ncbi:MAG: leucine-rich repeat protein, partial [Ruminococcus sp.]|nr:leucine-rich repeat protein [Ruminococcus sp.]
IPSMAFSAGLTSVTLNEGTNTLEKWAFINCKNLTSITIPASVTSIGQQAVGYYHANGESTDSETKKTDFVIKGYSGSAAESYAKNNGFKFESIGTVCTHSYGNAFWKWDGYTSATARFTCQKCSNVQTLDASITNEVTKEPTCSATGVRTYTASVTFGGTVYTGAKYETLEKDPDNHIWSATAVWTWSSDYKTATAKLTCTKNSSHTVSVDTNEISSEVTKAPTCNSTGIRTYTATVTINGNTYTGTTKETLPIDENAHIWNTTANWSWSSNYMTATAKVTCRNNSTHAITKDADSIDIVVTKEPTCSATGKRSYTATVTINGITYTSTKTKTISADANAHKWGTDAVWTWSSDYKTAAATVVCEINSSHSKSVNATVDTVDTKPATCVSTGVKTHTATATINDKTYTDTVTENTPVDTNAHVWGTTASWSWSSDYKTATATLTCTKSSSHTMSVNADTINTVVTKAATCTATGTKTHTATVTINGKTYTNTTTETTPVDADAHVWGTTPSWLWSSDYKSATLVFTCENNAAHSMNVLASVSTKTTASGCTEAGKTVYTASAAYGGKTYTDKREVSIAALGHNYIDSVTSPSCTTRGYTTHTCQRCKDSYVDAYTDALGHNWETWTTTTEPTCTSDGEQESSCTRCSEKTTRKVDMLGHNYVTTVVEPTCTEKGYTLHKCS